MKRLVGCYYTGNAEWQWLTSIKGKLPTRVCSSEFTEYCLYEYIRSHHLPDYLCFYGNPVISVSVQSDRETSLIQQWKAQFKYYNKIHFYRNREKLRRIAPQTQSRVSGLIVPFGDWRIFMSDWLFTAAQHILLLDPGHQLQLEESALKQSTIGIAVLFQMTNACPPSLNKCNPSFIECRQKGVDLPFCCVSQ